MHEQELANTLCYVKRPDYFDMKVTRCEQNSQK